MRIGLLGYGKMGKEIERIALERGHEIAWKIQKENRSTLDEEMLHKADVVIEFSQPATAVENILLCVRHRVPVVVGTTGWYAEMDKVRSEVLLQNAGLFYATNFSIGVHLFWKLNRELAQWMNGHKAYKAHVEEIHHIHKLDEPSGTGITTAEKIIEAHTDYDTWALEGKGDGVLPIYSFREGEVPGTHKVIWQSAEDKIMIEHEAFGRTGFAKGAVHAAEWLIGKTGIFTMSDMLG